MAGSLVAAECGLRMHYLLFVFLFNFFYTSLVLLDTIKIYLELFSMQSRMKLVYSKLSFWTISVNVPFPHVTNQQLFWPIHRTLLVLHAKFL